jgi:FkbM family methyltransferase
MYKLLNFIWNHPLNKGREVSAILRFFRWQVAVRLMDGPIALPFVGGTKLFAVRGMTGATGNWYCGLHEVDEMGFVLHACRPGDLFIDIGANIGSYSILAAGASGAQVVSIEPIPSTFSRLLDNVKLNRLETKVTCHNIGLSLVSGKLRFSSDLDTVNHVLREGEDVESIDVDVSRLDDFLTIDPNQAVIIKIDVEGHELSVLKGAETTLNNANVLAVVMETNGSGLSYGVTDDDLVAFMGKCGFEALGYFAVQRKLTAPHGGNTVFVRDKIAMMERIHGSKVFEINGKFI